MSLNATQIRNAKPTDKTQRLYDERGLYLEISPKGGMWWRFKYRFNNKEKRISLGTYPDVSLQQAREKRDEARKHVADGIDPSTHRQVMKQMVMERAANSFEVVAREWFAKHKSNWVDSHANKIIQRFQRDIFPWLGDNVMKSLPKNLVIDLKENKITRLAKQDKRETIKSFALICIFIFGLICSFLDINGWGIFTCIAIPSVVWITQSIKQSLNDVIDNVVKNH